MKLCLFLIIVSAVARVLAFPPFNLPELAFVCLVPLAYWATRRPAIKTFLKVVLCAECLSWLGLLFWLRHVTWGGLFLLAAILCVFTVSWFMTVRWVLPKVLHRSSMVRILVLMALASLWVLTEWLRSWVLTGFPWLPLAASQWQRPAMLSILPWTGAWGLSWALVFFNLSMVMFLVKLAHQRSAEVMQLAWSRRLCPEVICALLLVFGLLALFIWRAPALEEGAQNMMKVGFVQPNAEVIEAYDAAKIRRSLHALKEETLALRGKGLDVVLWPESALTLLPVIGDSHAQSFAEGIAQELEVPIIGGSLVQKADLWYNAIVHIDPQAGVSDTFYAKRKLVPFGEYVPWEQYLPFIRQVVPFEGDFSTGQSASIIDLHHAGQKVGVGGLVCYEDIFSDLAIDSVRDGADLLLVVNFNSWFGEEGGAWQHAAHSVLRAAETRRSILRCGNAGWSGWIDGYGRVRHRMQDAEGSIYFKGHDSVEMPVPKKTEGLSFYVRHPNRALIIAFLFVPFLLLGLKSERD